jgi:hypothetical protein
MAFLALLAALTLGTYLHIRVHVINTQAAFKEKYKDSGAVST